MDASAASAAPAPREPAIARAILAAMVLVVPWPVYLVAVLESEPIPLLVLSSLSPLGLLILPQAALAAWVFRAIARALAKRIAPSPARLPLTIAAVVAILCVAVLPVYGGGENLLGSSGKFHDLHTEVMHSMGRTTPAEMERFRALERDRPEARIPQKGNGPAATLEDLGQPQVRIEPAAPVPIEFTPPQLECMQSGKSSSECGVVVRVPQRRTAP